MFQVYQMSHYLGNNALPYLSHFHQLLYIHSHLRDVVVTVLFVVHVAMVIIFLWSHCTRNK